jgi:hypothetical protein
LGENSKQGLQGSAINDYGKLLLVVSSVFLILSIADFWLFIYHPFQLNIVVDMEGRDQQERM